MTDKLKADITPERAWSAIRRDSDGLRQLRDYLNTIKEFDDAAFAETTAGADHVEMMDLLHRIEDLLAELDKITSPDRKGAD